MQNMNSCIRHFLTLRREFWQIPCKRAALSGLRLLKSSFSLQERGKRAFPAEVEAAKKSRDQAEKFRGQAAEAYQKALSGLQVMEQLFQEDMYNRRIQTELPKEAGSRQERQKRSLPQRKETGERRKRTGRTDP